jgi:hypothetical protein
LNTAGEGVQQLAAALQAAVDHLVASESKQQHQLGAGAKQPQQHVGADALAAAVAAAVAGAAARSVSSSGSNVEGAEEDWDEDEYEDWEGEEGEEWVAAALAQAEGGQLTGAGSSDDETAPQPLAADDPDRWLLELSEEQLLAMADSADV